MLHDCDTQQLAVEHRHDETREVRMQPMAPKDGMPGRKTQGERIEERAAVRVAKFVVDLMSTSLAREPWKVIKSIKPDKEKARLVIGDQYSHVETDKPAVFRELQKAFTFLNPSFWFMKQRFGSHARARFLTQTQFITQAGRFPTGILEDVIGRVRVELLLAICHRSFCFADL